jgi:hypothetical protein
VHCRGKPTPLAPQAADTGMALGGNDAVMLYNLLRAECLLGDIGKGVESFVRSVGAGNHQSFAGL